MGFWKNFFFQFLAEKRRKNYLEKKKIINLNFPLARSLCLGFGMHRLLILQVLPNLPSAGMALFWVQQPLCHSGSCTETFPICRKMFSK